MAVTSIWPITGNPGNVIDYVANPQKTTEGGLSELAALHAIDNVVEYTADQMKTEKCQYVSGVNCIPSDAINRFMRTKKKLSFDNFNKQFFIIFIYILISNTIYCILNLFICIPFIL